MGIIS